MLGSGLKLSDSVAVYVPCADEGSETDRLVWLGALPALFWVMVTPCSGGTPTVIEMVWLAVCLVGVELSVTVTVKL